MPENIVISDASPLIALIESGKGILSKLELHGFWLSEQLKAQILARLKE